MTMFDSRKMDLLHIDVQNHTMLVLPNQNKNLEQLQYFKIIPNPALQQGGSL